MSDLLSAEPFDLIDRLWDPPTGLVGYIVIHSRARGPAFGGCRLWSYADEWEALADAKRLAEGMSYKNALAGLPFGGGKAVLIPPPTLSTHPDVVLIPKERERLFRAFGKGVAALHGLYITAEDVGTTPEDTKVVRSETRYVSGIPKEHGFGGDPARFTAHGVFLSIQAAVRQVIRLRVQAASSWARRNRVRRRHPPGIKT